VDRSTAEDVVQRVFVKLITDGRIPSEFRAWLFRCVRNEAISASRSARRRLLHHRSATPPPLFVQHCSDLIDVDEAQQALTQLKPGPREVVTLRIWSGLSFAEISAVTGVPLSTVYDQYKSALAELKQKLETPCRIR